MNKRLAVIIPMFNEEHGAERCVREMFKVLDASLPDVPLYVVNDGSADQTPNILENLKAQYPRLKVLHHQKNAGYGAALLTGARAAHQDHFEFGLFMDSDLTNDPQLIKVFEQKIQAGSADVYKASRYVDGGGMSGVPLKRRMISIIGNFIASSLFGVGVHDVTNGFRAVRLAMIADVQFTERGFPSILEEMWLLKKKGAKFQEIPYVLTSRTDGDQNSKFRYNAKMFWNYLKYALKAVLIR